MNKISKLAIIFIVPVFFSQIKMEAQISTNEKPVSFGLGINLEIPTLIMPVINIDSVKQYEAELGNTPRPFRFGIAMDVDIDLKRVGSQVQLSNGDKLYFLKIHSANAYSINLIYNQFRLSKDSKFFVYNEDKSMSLGAFTPKFSNNPHNVFATDLVKGHTIILEYYNKEQR